MLYAREGAHVAITGLPAERVDIEETRRAVEAEDRRCLTIEGNPPEKVASFAEKTPLKRPAQPEELAPAYVFLASNADSSYITGEVLAVMGGGTTG